MNEKLQVDRSPSFDEDYSDNFYDAIERNRSRAEGENYLSEMGGPSKPESWGLSEEQRVDDLFSR